MQVRYPNFTLSLLGPPVDRATVKEEMLSKLPHKHVAVVKHQLRQRAGIPYEVETKVCSACARVLDERPLKRAAA
jgi:hypothetical protein